MKTTDKILNIIKEKYEISPHELSNSLEVSERSVFKSLAKLLAAGSVQRIGTPPKVFYRINTETELSVNDKIVSFSNDENKVLEKEFLYVTPLGESYSGIEGFVKWCIDRNFNPDKKITEYMMERKNVYSKYSGGLVDATNKIAATYEETGLSKLYYIDFYSIPKFGKTKLGQLLLYAKQSQDKVRIKEITEIVRPKIMDLIKNKQIDAVGFIPATVKREIQFMREFEKILNLSLPILRISKIQTDIVVPQKTLSKIKDRVSNAKNTLIVEEHREFKSILLIDDAVGSGATLNEVSKKIIQKGLGKKVFGLAIAGSYKGFDVISEV